MAKYTFTFAKEGYLKYISHLDLQRLFKRAFKKSDVKLRHSEGFNPHPKMIFAQPLSLGYTGIGEFLEFETIETFEADELKDRIQAIMPEGIRIIECEEREEEGKSLASKCVAADYIIGIRMEDDFSLEDDLAERFLKQKEILVQKKKKKSREYKEIDIKNLIENITLNKIDNNLFMSTKLAAGSTANLSPELLLDAFFKFIGRDLQREKVEILRTKLYT